MMKFYFRQIALLAAFLFGFSGLYAQVSVTATAGTPGPTTYATLNAAFAAINAGTHQGSIQISITGNTTEPAVSVPLLKSATPSSYTDITIKPSGGDFVIGSAAAPTASRGVIELNGADNVTIDGDDVSTPGIRNLTFSVTQVSTTGIAAIRFASSSATDGATFNTVKNCIIKGSRLLETSTTANYGIYSGTAGTASISASGQSDNNDNLTIQNNLISRCFFGIYAAGTTANYMDNLVIQGNTLGTSAATADRVVRAIYVQNTQALSTPGASVAVIDGNDIQAGTTNGGNTYSALEIANGNAGAIVKNNYIHDCLNPTSSVWGMYGIGITGSTNNSAISIYNNFIRDISGYGTSSTGSPYAGSGIALTVGVLGMKINGNTIVQSSTALSGAMCLFFNSSTATLAECQNNIFVNNINSQYSSIIYTAATGNISGAVMNNNNYYRNAAPSPSILGYYSSANRLTLAAWQSATGKDANSKNILPGFKSTTDLHIDTTASSNLQLFRTGVTLPAVSVDIDGQTRNSPPCIGADEFVFPSCAGQPDAGILAASVNPVCLGSSSLLSVSGITSTDGAGSAYQWFESTDSTTWSAISGATGLSYNYSSASAKKYFMFVNTCTVSTLADSAYVTVDLNNPNYATVPYKQTFDSWISVCGNTEVPTNEWRNSPLTGNNSWRRQDQGSTAAWSSATGIVTPKTGAGAANFHSYDATAGTFGTFDLYADMSSLDPITLKFDYFNASGTDSLFVQFSQDNGVTFSDMAAFALATTWTSQVVSLGVVARPQCVVRFKAKSDYGASDIGIDNLSLSLPCSGKPTAGVITSTQNSVCAGSAISLSLTGNTVADGITYQWITSTDSINYSSLSVDTFDSYNKTISVPTFYKAILTCSGQSDTTAAFKININPVLQCYCKTNLGGSCGANNITNVKFGNINNTSVCNTVTAGAYTSFPDTGVATTNLYRTVTSSMTVTLSGASIVSAWIDFDQSGTFDASEWTQVTTTASSATVSILVPGTAVLGKTGMRIRSRGTGNPNGSTDACTNFGSGETEDYLVTILPAPACTNPPVGGLITGNLSVCTGNTTTLVDTGYTLGTTTQWLTSTDSITWTVIPGATTSSYATPIVTSAAFYKFRSVCVDTAYSPVVKVVIAPVTNCYCVSGATNTGDTKIDSVSFSTVVTGSAATTCETYTDYTAQVGNIQQLVPFNLTVRNGSCSGDHYGAYLVAFIDYNQNGLFTDPGETVYTSPLTTGLNTLPVASITAPASSTLGLTRMRLVFRETTVPSACGTYGYGETEDYTVNILAAPPCVTPPSAGVVTGPATAAAYTQGIYVTTGSVGTKIWQFSTSPAGPYVTVAGVTGDTLSINLNVSDTFYFRTIATNPGCSNDTLLTPFQTIITLLGDNVCNALPLSLGANGPFITTAGTIQVGEPTPPSSGCSVQTGWCNTTLSNSLWFSFVAPTSGRVTIQSPDFDTQLALWSADNCDTILKGGATLVAANDDDGSYTAHSGVQFSSFLGPITCLTPGKTYYVQLDPYSSPGDTTSIVLTDLGALDPAFTLDTVYCQGAPTVALNPVTAGGTFTGTGVSGTNFSPVTAGVGGPYLIKYALSACDTLVKSTKVVAAPSATTAITNVDCFGGSTGAINVTITGNSPFSSTWSNAATTEDLTAVAAGTYSDTIKDVYGCKAVLSALTVAGPSAALAGAFDSLTNVKCYGDSTGAIYVSVSGGTAPYTYLWSNGATTEDVTHLPAGLYTGTVTDAKGCTFTAPQPVPVTQPAAALATAIDSTVNVKCNGQLNGGIYVSVTGGTTAYTYAWTGGSTNEDLTGVAAGSYTLTVTDANACSVSVSGTVTEPTVLTATTDSTKNVTCNGLTNGAVYVSVNGGTTAYTYAWNSGATTEDITAIAAGTYTLTVTDANGCSTSASGTVTEPTVLATTTDSTKNVTCKGLTNGAVYISVSGGTTSYTYAWTGGATTQDLTAVAAGTYTVSVTDANGCSTTATGTVSEPAVLAATTDSIVNVKCNAGTNGAVYITVTGGTSAYTYAWTGGATTQDLLGVAAGAYTVSVTDAHGCSTTATGTVTAPTALSLTTDSIKNVLCNGQANGAVYISVAGGTAGYTYSWTGGSTSQDLTGVTSGAYVVTVTDANGCIKTTNATVSQPSVLSVSTTKTNEIQGGTKGSVSAVVTGGTPTYSYVWTPSGNTATINNLAAGTYKVTVTDANGCTATAQDTVKLIVTGIDNIDEVSVFNVYPNPTSNKFFVQVEMAEKVDIQLELRSTAGQLVYTANEMDVKSKVIEVNATDFAGGIYIVRLVFGDKQITRRITISK